MKIIRFASASTCALFGAATLFLCGPAHAGGFALSEMSAGSLGNAHAGGAAAAEDLATIYYNPAGLMRMSGQQFMISGTGIRPSAEFQNRGSVSAVGTPLTGGNGGDAGSWAGVPALYYAMDLAPRLRFGIGVQSPFGLVTEYDAGWVGRYQALKSELKSININPSLAYKVNDMLAVGGGVSAQYVNVELSRAIDFGSVCFGAVGAATCTAIGFAPQAKDGAVNVKGNDWGYGFNLGALVTPNDKMRFGVSYRSKISYELSGDANFTKPAGLPGPIAASPSFTNTGAKANLDLPELISVSGYMDLDPKWSMMADLSWQHWSRFKELRVRFNNGAADSVTPENWRNTYRVAVAVNYRYNDQWKLRSGVAYDQSPVQGQFVTPRIPDNNRIWLAFGAQYKPSRNDTWDIGYAHLFVQDTSINKSEPPIGGTLTGTYNNDVNILGVQYSHTF
jgi:long-chain fatty acid transport protein